MKILLKTIIAKNIFIYVGWLYYIDRKFRLFIGGVI